MTESEVIISRGGENKHISTEKNKINEDKYMTTYEKKRLYGMICLAVAAVGIILTAALILLGSPNVGDPIPTYDRESVADVVAPTNESFVLREHENIIGIFDTDGNLLGSINLPTVTLPAVERARLTEGIKVESREELERLIESYS